VLLWHASLRECGKRLCGFEGLNIPFWPSRLLWASLFVPYAALLTGGCTSTDCWIEHVWNILGLDGMCWVWSDATYWREQTRQSKAFVYDVPELIGPWKYHPDWKLCDDQISRMFEATCPLICSSWVQLWRAMHPASHFNSSITRTHWDIDILISFCFVRYKQAREEASSGPVHDSVRWRLGHDSVGRRLGPLSLLSFLITRWFYRSRHVTDCVFEGHD